MAVVVLQSPTSFPPFAGKRLRSGSEATRRRHVSFAANVAHKETMGLEDYTQQEIKETWLAEEEINAISKQCIKILAKIERGTALNKKHHCARGLESHTLSGSVLKHRNRETAIMSVLEEQQRQFEATGIVDNESLSLVYRRTTPSHQMWAQVLAGRDRRDADSYLFEDEGRFTGADWQTSYATLSPYRSAPRHSQETISRPLDPKLDSARAA